MHTYLEESEEQRQKKINEFCLNEQKINYGIDIHTFQSHAYTNKPYTFKNQFCKIKIIKKDSKNKKINPLGRRRANVSYRSNQQKKNLNSLLLFCKSNKLRLQRKG